MSFYSLLTCSRPFPKAELDNDNCDQAEWCLRALNEMVQGNESGGNARFLVGTTLLNSLFRILRKRPELAFQDGDEVRASICRMRWSPLYALTLARSNVFRRCASARRPSTT